MTMTQALGIIIQAKKGWHFMRGTISFLQFSQTFKTMSRDTETSVFFQSGHMSLIKNGRFKAIS